MLAYNAGLGKLSGPRRRPVDSTANPRTKILDFGGFDSSAILILRSEIPRPVGDFPESLSQAILAGVILVGRLGVLGKLNTSCDVIVVNRFLVRWLYLFE